MAAAPTAAPMNPFSEMGVSLTRSGPYFAIKPPVSLTTPPQASSNSSLPAPPATSSPIRITEGSLSNSWWNDSLTACAYVSALTGVLTMS